MDTPRTPPPAQPLSNSAMLSASLAAVPLRDRWRPAQLRLLPGEAHTLPLTWHRGGAVLMVVGGRAWVTQTGHPDDHVLQAGDQLPLQDRGAVVVECEGAEPVEWAVLRPPGPAQRLARVAAALLRAALRWFGHWPSRWLARRRPAAMHPD